MDLAQQYTTQSGKQYLIKICYNENIRDTDGFEKFLKSVEVLDSERHSAPITTSASQFSTYQNYTTFGSFAAINYMGLHAAALEGLCAKVLVRIQDHLEAQG